MIGGFAVWGVLLFFIMFGIFAIVNTTRQLSTIPQSSHSYNYGGSSQYGSGSGNNSGTYGSGGSTDNSDDSGSGSSTGSDTSTYGTGQGSSSTAAPIQGFSPNNDGKTGN